MRCLSLPPDAADEDALRRAAALSIRQLEISVNALAFGMGEAAKAEAALAACVAEHCQAARASDTALQDLRARVRALHGQDAAPPLTPCADLSMAWH